MKTQEELAKEYDPYNHKQEIYRLWDCSIKDWVYYEKFEAQPASTVAQIHYHLFDPLTYILIFSTGAMFTLGIGEIWLLGLLALGIWKSKSE